MEAEVSAIGKEFMEGLKKSMGMAIAVGALLVVMGVLAIGSPLIAGMSVSLYVGIVLLVSGIGQVFLAFKAGSFGRGLLSAILSVMSAVAGLIMIVRPGVGLASLTLVLAAYCMVTGIIESMWAFQIKPAKGWGWALFSGIASVLLGIMILSEYPFSGVWAIGTLLGFRLVFGGWSLIMLGAGVRSAVKAVKG